MKININRDISSAFIIGDFFVCHYRFLAMEEAIAKNAKHSYLYARFAINGRFKLGEEAISKHTDYQYLYNGVAMK